MSIPDLRKATLRKYLAEEFGVNVRMMAAEP